MFRNEIAQEIEILEGKITEFNNKLDFIFKSSSIENDGVEATIMNLVATLSHLEKKKEKLEQTFWSLI